MKPKLKQSLPPCADASYFTMFATRGLSTFKNTCSAQILAYIYLAFKCLGLSVLSLFFFSASAFSLFFFSSKERFNKLHQSCFTIHSRCFKLQCGKVYRALLPVSPLLAFSALLSNCCCYKQYICTRETLIYQYRLTRFSTLVSLECLAPFT